MIVSCGECGKDVSDKAAACPHCGAPVPQTAQTASAPAEPRRSVSIPWGWIIPVVIAAIAFATKPEVSRLEDMIYEEALAAAQNQEITEDDNLLSGFLKFGCVLDAPACAEEMTNRTVIRDRDLLLIRIATITLDDAEASCWGIFGDWWCNDDEAA